MPGPRSCGGDNLKRSALELREQLEEAKSHHALAAEDLQKAENLEGREKTAVQVDVPRDRSDRDMMVGQRFARA